MSPDFAGFFELSEMCVSKRKYLAAQRYPDGSDMIKYSRV
jgi:hypothetical protein